MDYKEQIQKLVGEIKAQGYENICIWMPALNMGGATIYCTFVNYLLKHTDLKIYYMDYIDGYNKQFIEQTENFKFLTYKDEDVNFPLKEKCIILCNSTRVIQMKNMHPENKFLFWHWETLPCAWNEVFVMNETKKYLKLTKKEKAMVYHDWSGRDSLNRYQHMDFTNKEYISLVLPAKNKECSSDIIEETSLNIGFLSRLVPDKIQGLFYLIDSLNRYETKLKKRLHIIGDGRSRVTVEKFCKNYKNIEFIFTGTVSKEKLDDYLIHNIDILFGVGTCVLEAAALKIPSAVCILDKKRIYEDEVFWIYNTIEYCVGITKEEKRDFKVNYTKIHDILNGVYIDNRKQIEGNKCYEYYKKYHSNLDELIHRLLVYLKNSTLTFKKLKKTIKYVPYNQLKIKSWRIFHFICISVVEHLNKKKYLLFNKISLFKIVSDKNIKKYYLFGLKVGSSKQVVPCRFLASSFRDKVENKKGAENVK